MLRLLFRRQPSRETAIAAAAGLAAIGLSLLMIPLARWPWAEIVVRDLGQVWLLGFVFPLLSISRDRGGFAEFGLHARRWPLFLAINLALAIGLYFQFRAAGPPPADFRWDAATIWKAAYVVLAVTFECLFFYAFLRTLFERAFGAVAGIVLAAAFYTFHHAGFQPEFAKLFLVGVMYATVIRLANSALVIWPFFLGVGGVYDVLLKSKVVSAIHYPEIRTVGLAALMTLAVLWIARYRRSQQGG